MSEPPKAPQAPPRRAIRAVWTALAIVSAACAAAPRAPEKPRDVIVLLPDAAGKTGAVAVSGAGTERVLSQPWQAVAVEAGAPPGEPFTMTRDDVGALMGPALSALPPPPLRFVFHFVSDTTELTPESRAMVDRVTRAVRERNPVEIAVVGHTDTVGSREYNHALGLRRARAVAAILAAGGVDSALCVISSHGEENPAVPTGDETEEPRNRRVEVTVR